MNATQRPQRAFLTVTLLTVIAVSTVFMVYAAVLMTLLGTTVTVSETGGLMQYNRSNTSNSTWVSSLPTINNGSTWYARINITGSAQQAVTINWVLQQNTGSWIDLSTPVTTSITLAVGDNTVYATSTGVFSGNYNWGLLTTTGGSYRVKAVVNG
jgi:hypothetical protein